MVYHIEKIDPDVRSRLGYLLMDAVGHGASIGFLQDLDMAKAAQYWASVGQSLGTMTHLFVAAIEGKIAGTIQLVPCKKDNGRHRAEICKLLVDSAYQGKGIASGLLKHAEDFARKLGLSLLYLDTESGSRAELIYRHLGWTHAGNIPDYAAIPDGSLIATAIYYKRL